VVFGWSEASEASEAINFYILVRFWCCTVGHCTVVVVYPSGKL
jgi:hypothetical protein